GLLSPLLSPLRAAWRRRRGLPPAPPLTIPGPIRLLLVAAGLRFLVATIALSLFERLFWTATARLLSTTSIVWLGLQLTAYGERYISRRAGPAGVGEVAAILRLARRTADVLVIALGALLVL